MVKISDSIISLKTKKLVKISQTPIAGSEYRDKREESVGESPGGEEGKKDGEGAEESQKQRKTD